MSVLLTCNIEIGDYYFPYAESVEIESSWKELGDKCTIKLPNKAVLEKTSTETEEVSLEKTFITGMPVKVSLGYDGNNNVCFYGYVAHIKPNTPLELICEDEIYKLKRSKRINKVYNGTLKNLLTTYFEGVKIDKKLPDVSMTNFVLKEVTQAEILKKLKEEYGFCAFFRNKELYVGLPYFIGSETEHIFHFQKNVISEELEYKKEDDVRMKAVVKSFLSNNKFIEEKVGDDDGEQKTFFYPGVGEGNKAKLKAFGEMELKKLKFEGYRGNIEAFGLPFVQHSETALLYDDRYEERSGQGYAIDGVKLSWGSGGFHNKYELGPKLTK